jgi:hypothetical protein
MDFTKNKIIYKTLSSLAFNGEFDKDEEARDKILSHNGCPIG